MAKSYFEVKLSVKPEGGGAARLVIPNVLQRLDYQFVMVQEGGREGVILLDESTDTAKKVARDKKCKKLTKKQMEKVLAGYPPPRLKKKFRFRELNAKAEDLDVADQFEVDKKGEHIVDTFQTIRSDFYLIDVPVLAKNAK